MRAAYVPLVIGSAAAVSIAPDSIPLGTVAPTMGDAMRRLPFIYLRQNSRGETEVSVRGSESRQAAVFFEGVPLTLTWDARADVSAVPMAGVAQVQYVRGLSSLLAGPNAIGGVVSASLWNDHDPLRAPAEQRRLSVQGDQFGGLRSTATLGGALSHSAERSIQYRVGGGWRDLPGMARPDGVDGPGEDDRLRLNTDARAYELFGGLRYENAHGRYLSGFASVSDGARGVAPELHINSPRLWRNPTVERRLASIAAGTGAITSPLGVGDLEFSLGVNQGEIGIESYTDRSYSVVDERERGEDETVTMRVTFDQTLGERVVLRGAYTDASVRYLETVNSDPSARYRQRLTSLAGEVETRLAEHLVFSAGLSQDAAHNTEAGGRPPQGRLDGMGWRGGLSWLIPSRAMRVHASASERKRFPALRELYSGALNRFVPNPDLRPETARSAEVGLSAAVGLVDAQVVLFTQGIEDAVVRVTLPSNQFQRVNRDRFSSNGVELTMGTLLGGTALRGDLTLQRARIEDQSISDPELRRPEDVPSVFGSLMATRPFGRGYEAMGRLRMLGETRCSNPDTGTLDRQAGATTVDVGLDRRWARGLFGAALRLSLQLENALDQPLYDKCGLPQAGRTLRFGLTLG